MNSLSFQSYSGFKSLIIDHNNFSGELSELFNSIDLKTPLFNLRNEYKQVCLLDTFFSDSFPDSLLNKIISKSHQDSFTTQILILDPFSELAQSRSKALDQNAFEEVNTAIRNIRRGVALLNNGRRSLSQLNKKFEKKKASPDFIFEQLKALREEKGDEILVEVKFYSCLSEVPVYILGPFIAKGLVLEDTSAKYNPWLIFVDDSSCKGDLYDSYRKNFFNLWEEANEFPGILNADSKKIFISWGGTDFYKTIAEKIILEKGFTPILYSKNGKKGKHHMEILENLTNQCYNAIIIMSKADLMENKLWRARQNVIHELGFCQAKYGMERVLLLVEEEIEMLSNLNGINSGEFSKDKLSLFEDIINEFIESILQKKKGL